MVQRKRRARFSDDGLDKASCFTRVHKVLRCTSITCHTCCGVPSSVSHLAPMAATSGSSWVCVECGKVCKSRGGLMKHSYVHKRRSRTVGGLHENFLRVYHPTFDGMLLSLLNRTLLTISREALLPRWGVSPIWNAPDSPTLKTQGRLDPFPITRRI